MSFITRRGLSTLIPPKVASPNATELVETYDNILTFWLQAIGGAQDAARMQRVVSFYEKLPRGPAPDVKPKGLFGRYQARYFGKNPSAAPIVHVIGALLLLGYANNYYFHLRHHKNNAH
ncbi:MAG: hypothetical protein LQ347_003622 [Umbilicaria vellea]|nr:MAG: hypothetical protein LQ347_003622 [Umbilicaria vellea]